MAAAPPAAPLSDDEYYAQQAAKINGTAAGAAAPTPQAPPGTDDEYYAGQAAKIMGYGTPGAGKAWQPGAHAPVLPPVPTTFPAPVTYTPQGQAQPYSPPASFSRHLATPAGGINYHAFHQGILATEAGMKQEGGAIAGAQAGIRQRAALLKQEEAEILKGNELRQAHPEDFSQDRVIAFNQKVDRHQAAVAAIQKEEDALDGRRAALHETISGYQRDFDAYKNGPANVPVPKITLASPPATPAASRFNDAFSRYQAVRKGPDAARTARADQERALAAVALAPELAKGGQRETALAQSGQQLAGFAAQLNDLVRQQKQGQLSPGAERRLVQAAQQFKRAVDAHDQAERALFGQRQNVAALIRERGRQGRPLHFGSQYPEEVAAAHGKPMEWVEQHLHQLQDMFMAGTSQAERQVTQIHTALQLAGKEPALPPLPKGTPQQQQQYIDWKNEALLYARSEYLGQHPQSGPGMIGVQGGNPEELAAWLARLKQNPFQAQILPILRQQVAADQQAKSQAHLGRAFADSLSTNLLAMLGGEAAAGAAAGLTGRLLSRVPAVARLFAEPLFAGGAARTLAKVGVRAAARFPAGYAGGAAASSIATMLQGLQQGQGLKRAVTGSLKALNPGGLLGGAASIGLGLAAEAGGEAVGSLRREFSVRIPEDPAEAALNRQIATQSLDEQGLSREFNDYLDPNGKTNTASFGQRLIQRFGLSTEDGSRLMTALHEIDQLPAEAASDSAIGMAPRHAALLNLIRDLEQGGPPAAATGGAPVEPSPRGPAPAAPAAPVTPEAPSGPQAAAPTATITAERPLSIPTEDEVGATAGGYRQGPGGALGAAHGPVVTSPTGVPVPLRLQSVPALTGLLSQYRAANDPAHAADVERLTGFLQRVEQYQQQQQPPPELLPVVVKEFEGSDAQAAVQALAKLSTDKAHDFPQLAATLGQAVDALRKDFGEAVAIAQPHAQEYDLGYPLSSPFASPYRQLTGAERGQLTPETRRALLIQDIVNSTQTLHPGTPPFFALPNSGNMGQLQRQADNLFQAAQVRQELEEVGRAHPAPNSPLAGRIVSGIMEGRVQPQPLQTTPLAPELSQPLGVGAGAASVPVIGPAPAALGSLSPRLRRVLKALAARGRATPEDLAAVGLNPDAARQVLQELQGRGWLGADGRLTVTPADVEPILAADEQGVIRPYAAGPLSQRPVVAKPVKAKSAPPVQTPPAAVEATPTPVETAAAPMKTTPATTPARPKTASPAAVPAVRLRSNSGTVIRVEAKPDGTHQATVEVESPGSPFKGQVIAEVNPEGMIAGGKWHVVEEEGAAKAGPVKAAPAAPKTATPAAPRPRERPPASVGGAAVPEPVMEAGEAVTPRQVAERQAALGPEAGFDELLEAVPSETAVKAEAATAPTVADNVIPAVRTGKHLTPTQAKEVDERRLAAMHGQGFDQLAAGAKVKFLPTRTVFALKAPQPERGPYVWTATVVERGFAPMAVDSEETINFGRQPADWQLNPPATKAKPARAKLAETERQAPPGWAAVGQTFDHDPAGNHWRLESYDEQQQEWKGTLIQVSPEAKRLGIKPGRVDMFTNPGLHQRDPVGPLIVTPNEAKLADLTAVETKIAAVLNRFETAALDRGAAAKALAPLHKEWDGLAGELQAAGETVERAGRGALPKQAPAAKPATPAPAAAKAALVPQGRATVFVAGESEYRGQFTVVPIGELVTSHDNALMRNPAFPEEYQPRDRAELASQAQVSEIERKLNPILLGENPLAGHGAPIVAPDGIVESGNGRTIGVRRAYQKKNAGSKAYRNWLLEHAAEFGLTRDQVEAIPQPLLVRVRTERLGAKERRQFVERAGVDQTLAMGAKASAKLLASRFTPGMMAAFNPDEEGSLNAASNRPWVTALLSLLPANEAGDYYAEVRGKSGKRVQLNPAGLALAANALFYAAYGDEGLLDQVANAPQESPVRNLTGAMLKAAGEWARLRSQIESGHAYDLDLTENLLAAVHKLVDLRERKIPVADWLAGKQQEIDLDHLTDFDKEILTELEKRKGSAKALRTLLADYVDLALQAGDPTEHNAPALFEGHDYEPPTVRVIWDAARARSGGTVAAPPTVSYSEEGRPAGHAGRAGGSAASRALAAESQSRRGDRTQRAVNDRLLARYVGDPRERYSMHIGEKGVAVSLPLKGTESHLVIDPELPFPLQAARFLARSEPALRRALFRFMRGMTPKEQRAVTRFGLLLLPGAATLNGLNNMVVFAGHRIYQISLNPFVGDVPLPVTAYRNLPLGERTPAVAAHKLALTLLHELAHIRVRENEGADLWDEMDRIHAAMGEANWAAGVHALELALTGGKGNDAGFSELYRAGRAEYFAAARLGGGGFLHRLGPGDAGGGSAGRHALRTVLQESERTAAGDPGPGGWESVPGGVELETGRATGGQSRGPGRVVGRPPGIAFAEEVDPKAQRRQQFAQAYVPEVANPQSRAKRMLAMADLYQKGLHREYARLPQGARYEPVRMLFRQLLRGGVVGRNRAYLHVARVKRGLSEEESRQFDWAKYVLNMEEDLRRLEAAIREKDPKLSDEEVGWLLEGRWQAPELETADGWVTVWTPAALREEKAALGALPAKVTAALAMERKLIREVADDLTYWAERATGKKLDLSREEYLHQQVLAYALDPETDAYRALFGTGREVKAKPRGFLKQRQGTTLAHNTAYAASIMDWLPTAFYDVAMYQAIAQVREQFDVLPQVKLAANKHNEAKLLAHYEKRFEKNPLLWRKSDPESQMRSELNTNLARAFSYFEYLAGQGVLPDAPDGRYAELIESLAGLAVANRQAWSLALEEDLPIESARLHDDETKLLIEYAGWLLSESRKAGEGVPGSGAAARLFQAATEKRKKVQEILGREFRDPEDMLRLDPRWKGKFRLWQPGEARVVFRKLALEDRVGEELMRDLAATAEVDAADLSRVLVIGGKGLSFALPIDLAHTLDHLDDYLPLNPAQAVAKEVIGAVKQVQIFNPVHSVEFALRKWVTDAHAMSVGQVHALPLWPKAFKEMGRYMLGQLPTPDGELMAVLLRGGAMVQPTLGGEVPGLKGSADFMHGLAEKQTVFEKLMQETQGQTPAKLAAWLKEPETWRQIATLYGREAVALIDASARFATYLAYLEGLKANHGELDSYGFAIPDEVTSLLGHGRTKEAQVREMYRDRAWKLSNALMVAYDETPPALRAIADWWIAPFMRWEAGNIRRWARRLAEPAWRERTEFKLYEALTRAAVKAREESIREGGGDQPPVPPKGPGSGPNSSEDAPEPPELPLAVAEMAKSPRVVGRVVGVALLAYMWTNVQRALGALRHDLWRDLPEEIRGRVPFILGTDPLTGKTMAIPRLSSFTEAGRAVGLDNVWGYTERGIGGPLEAALEILGRNPIRELYAISGPTKIPLEAALGRTGYPDPFHPRNIRNTWGYIFDQFGVGANWKYLENMATKSVNREPFRVLGVHEYDRLESNYYEIKGLAGKEHGSGSENPKNAALYHAHQAAREGDLPGAAYFMALYVQHHGDKRGERQSLMQLDPLYGMKPAAAAKWVTSLSPDDQARVRGALLYWKGWVDPTLPRAIPIRPDLMALPIDRFVTRVRAEMQAAVKASDLLGNYERHHPAERGRLEAVKAGAR